MSGQIKIRVRIGRHISALPRASCRTRSRMGLLFLCPSPPTERERGGGRKRDGEQRLLGREWPTDRGGGPCFGCPLPTRIVMSGRPHPCARDAPRPEAAAADDGKGPSGWSVRCEERWKKWPFFTLLLCTALVKRLSYPLLLLL